MIVISTEAARHALAVVTAVRGVQKTADLAELTELVAQAEWRTNSLALIALAQVICGLVSEEQLQEHALRIALDDGMSAL